MVFFLMDDFSDGVALTLIVAGAFGAPCRLAHSAVRLRCHVVARVAAACAWWYGKVRVSLKLLLLERLTGLFCLLYHVADCLLIGDFDFSVYFVRECG